jgi:glycine/D-amino acid oxidase-like deaminating enzyme
MVALPVDPTTPLIKNSHAFFSETHDGRELADHVMQKPRGKDGKSYLMFGGGRAHAANNGARNADDSMLEPAVKGYLKSALPKMPGVGVASHEAVAWAGHFGILRLPLTVGWRVVQAMIGILICGGYSGHGMPLASRCGDHIAELMVRSLEEGDWRDQEKSNIEAGKLPRGYEISEERIANAKKLGIADLGARV